MNRFTSVDGTRIAYQEWGAGSGTPPVILHHGFVVDGTTNWVGPGVVAALVDAGRRVIAPDARGHGASDKPHDPARYGEDIMARDLSALIDLIGADRVDLVGYSMGAIVATLTAARDRRVRRLVIGGVGAGVVELGGLDTRAMSTAEVIAALLADDPAAVADSPAIGFRMLAEAVEADRVALAAQASAVHARPVPLTDITAPTLVLCGRDDNLAVRPQVLAGAIPHARLLIVPGDHLTAVRDPAFAPAIVDFLAEAEADATEPDQAGATEPDQAGAAAAEADQAAAAAAGGAEAA